MYSKYNYMYKSTILSIIEKFVNVIYSYISMHTEYNYKYTSTIEILKTNMISLKEFRKVLPFLYLS